MILQSLKIGDKGANVTKAQKLLQKTGSTIKVTGVFSIGMVSAVRAFQKKNGLVVTGVIDKKTFTKLSACKSPSRKK